MEKIKAAILKQPKTPIHARIKQARNEKGLTLAQLGEAVGVSAQAAQQWEDEENGTVPRAKRLDKVADALDVSAAWLQFGEAYMPGPGAIAVLENVDTEHTHKKISMYDFSLSAGPGNSSWIVNHEEDPLTFRERWFMARGLNQNTLRGMYVRGNSMHPELKDWDTVIIDASDLELVDDEIYAVVFKGKVYIKRVRQTEDGIALISSNPDYDTMEVTEENCDKFQVLGRMVWRGG